jgi:hypothetical protein
LTIKSTSHTPPSRQNITGRACERYFHSNFASQLHTKLVFCMPVKYSIVKDLDCLSNQQTSPFANC